MILNIKNHPFHYEMEKLTRIFLPDSELRVTDGCDESADFITTERIKGENSDTVCVSVSAGGYCDKKSAKVEKCENFEAACERKMAVLLYELLCSFTGYTPPWGILTGVRPAKLMNMLIDKTSENEAVSTFINELKVTREKTSLALSVAKKERPIIEKSKPDSFSLYVSIPFCPTRCSYCSFVSQANEQAKRLIPQYVEKLCEEIRITGREIKKLGLVLESVYWGGGTPTTLSASQYEKISSAIAESFDLSTAEEYTVEAGRPDSVSREKLEAIKKSGATRISINPQTFNDSVLEVIGRKHTSAQTQAAMLLAKECGFDNINMDLIAGLPTDTLLSFENTLDKALSFSPKSITVHTLALKRSSAIVTEDRETNEADLAKDMLSLAFKKLTEAEYVPYYMYRQSKCLGNLENVGWVKEGYECLYNVYMMEECHSVIAVGAGAVTKLKKYNRQEIERVYNFKYPYEYLNRFDEIIERKKKISEFYSKGL